MAPRLPSALALLCAAGAVLPWSSQALAAEKVAVGICVSWPGYAMLELAQSEGLAPGLDMNFTIFEDPLGGHAALAAGQIDVYGCTADYIPLTVQRGTDVVNVAFMNPSYGVDHVILAPGVEAKDLPGRKVSAPQAYIGQLLMGLWLDGQGLDVNGVEWVNLNADEAVGPMLSNDLAAAYMYEPWIAKVLEAMPGARSVVDTADPAMLETGIFMDSLFMNTGFIEERRDAALAVLKARFEGLGYWHENPAAANEHIAEFLQWPVEDVASVIGADGAPFESGIYLYDFDQSARVCGALEGEPPFGVGNGSMADIVARTNEWWVRLGLMDETIDATLGVDCSLATDLVAAGYRQSFNGAD